MRSFLPLISTRGLFLSALILLINAQAIARETVISSDRDAVNITIYQDPNRFDRAINASWPRGYALISEQRTITIPAGETQIRFEGVSEGMLPESAVVSALPHGVIEKNRGERLLSPHGLVDAYLKRRVTIKRTSAETGETLEKEVFITAGPTGGVIFESDEGFEALRCTGLPERIIYPKAPDDLSAKPTLSIITQSEREVRVTVTLTYLASGFDWQANYIANIEPDAALIGDKKMDLFAWLTVANGSNQSFDNANLIAIAGSPNRENIGRQIRPTGKELRLQCWPQGRTHQVPLRANFPPPPPSPVGFKDGKCDDCDVIFVTASKRTSVAETLTPLTAIKAEQENLGDLKLYRIPERVNVKAKGQKQVAMIVQPDAQYRRIFVGDVSEFDDGETVALEYVLRSKNDKKSGLGLPLPKGRFAVFENSNYGPLLIGEGSIDDSAIDGKVELLMPEVADVRLEIESIKKSKRRQNYRARLSNATHHAISAEIEIPYILSDRNKDIRKIDGIATWAVTVAANGEAVLKYSVKLERQ